jgi:hypothetical protein
MFENKFRLFLGVMAVLLLLVVVIFFMNKKSAAEKNHEEITIVLNNIAANAQTHYKRTNSFSGWLIPGSLRIEEVGTFREKVENEKIMVYVVGKEIGANGVSSVNIESVITGNNSTVKIRN